MFWIFILKKSNILHIFRFKLNKRVKVCYKKICVIILKTIYIFNNDFIYKPLYLLKVIKIFRNKYFFIYKIIEEVWNKI